MVTSFLLLNIVTSISCGSLKLMGVSNQCEEGSCYISLTSCEDAPVLLPVRNTLSSFFTLDILILGAKGEAELNEIHSARGFSQMFSKRFSD